jgi:hypothetical protein
MPRISSCGGNDYCTDTSMLLNFAYSVDPDNIASLSFYLPTNIQPFHIDAIKVNTKGKGYAFHFVILHWCCELNIHRATLSNNNIKPLIE